MRENISITFQFNLLVPAGQMPEADQGRAQRCVVQIWTRFVNGEVLSAPSHTPLLLFGWAATIAIAGALSPSFRRDEIWQSPFVLYIDNNPLISENHKGLFKINTKPKQNNTVNI